MSEIDFDSGLFPSNSVVVVHRLKYPKYGIELYKKPYHFYENYFIKFIYTTDFRWQIKHLFSQGEIYLSFNRKTGSREVHVWQDRSC